MNMSLEEYININLEKTILKIGNEGELHCRGTELVRRNTCLLIKHLLEDLNELIMHYISEEFIHDFINSFALNLMRGNIKSNSKKIIDTNLDNKSVKLGLLENKSLSNSLIDMNNIDLELYIMSNKLGSSYEKTKPCHAILAEKMNLRGDPVQIHERIQYMYTYSFIFDYEKVKKENYIEKPEYIKQFNLGIAYLAYLRDCVNPITDLLNIRFKDEFISIYLLRFSKSESCIYNSCKNKGSTLCVNHTNLTTKLVGIKIRQTKYSGNTGIIFEYRKVSYSEYIYNIHLRLKHLLHELIYDVFGPIFVEKKIQLNEYIKECKIRNII